MMEWILSSSVLILVVLLIRKCTLGKISMRLRYALWALVLVRLLVPFSFGSTPISIMNTAQQVPVIQEAEALQNIQHIERSPNGTVEGYGKSDSIADFPTVIAQNKTEADFARMSAMLDTREVLTALWKTGTLVLLAAFLLSNLHFRRSLTKTRTRMDLPDFPLPVYITEAVETPCIFGLFRPTVYVTPEVREDPKALHYALQHELTHFYHGDFLWSALRCVCLALHWFNPLVWLAVNLSRQDAELACDEGTIRRIGEAQRVEYGSTLIDLTCAKRSPSTLLHAATTMTGSKKSIRERVTFIAKRPKTLGAAVLAVLLLISAAVGCTFTGADQQQTEPNHAEVVPLTEEELSLFNENFFTQDSSIANQFLTSLYKTPAEIDLFQLFYNGTGLPGAISDEEIQALLDVHPEIWADTDCIKLPVQDMDAILQQYTGLTFRETRQIGMEQLVYLQDYDAYYCFHGDTNARPLEEFSAGFRQGDQVSLFYGDNKMVTLRETEDGYLFLSNQYAPIPSRPAQLPETEDPPFLTVPLKSLSTGISTSDSSQPVTPVVIYPTPFTRQEWGELVTSFLYEGSGGTPNRGILVGVWPDGGIYACYVVYDHSPGDDLYHQFVRLCDPSATQNFLEHPERISISAFTNLFGRDGFILSADGRNRYYSFAENGELSLFYSSYGRLDQLFTIGDCTYAFDGGSQWGPTMLIQQGETLYQTLLGQWIQKKVPDLFDLTLSEVGQNGTALCDYYDASLDPLRHCTARVYCDGSALQFLHGDDKTDTEGFGTTPPPAPTKPAELWGIKSGDPVFLSLESPGTTPQLWENHWTVNHVLHTFRYLSLLSWEPCEPLSTDAQMCTTVTLKTNLWSLTAFEGMAAVRKTQGDVVQWMRLAPSGDAANNPYDILRSWADELERAELLSREMVIPDRGQTWLEAAEEYAQGQYSDHLTVSNGSLFRWSFLKLQIEPAPENVTQAFRENQLLGENGHCFYVHVAFVPENDRALSYTMTENPSTYTGSDPEVPAGAYEDSRCCVIEKQDDGWHAEIGGTGW